MVRNQDVPTVQAPGGTLGPRSLRQSVETREEGPLASFIITEYGTMVHTLYSLLYIEASEMKLNPPLYGFLSCIEK